MEVRGHLEAENRQKHPIGRRVVQLEAPRHITSTLIGRRVVYLILASVMQSCTPSQTKGAVCFSKDLCLFRKEVCCCEYDNKYELKLQNSCDLSSGAHEAGEPPAESLQADVPVPLLDQRHRQ